MITTVLLTGVILFALCVAAYLHSLDNNPGHGDRP
jgi:hypothetical protein